MWQARRAAAADSHELLRAEHASRLAFRQRIQVATIYIRVDVYIYEYMYTCSCICIYVCVCEDVCDVRQPRTAACGACVTACFPKADSGGDYMYVYIHIYTCVYS